MPGHLHGIIAFRNRGKSLNSIIGNGKRFLAYDLVAALKQKQETTILNQLNESVRLIMKTHSRKYESRIICKISWIIKK